MIRPAMTLRRRRLGLKDDYARQRCAQIGIRRSGELSLDSERCVSKLVGSDCDLLLVDRGRGFRVPLS